MFSSTKINWLQIRFSQLPQTNNAHSLFALPLYPPSLTPETATDFKIILATIKYCLHLLMFNGTSAAFSHWCITHKKAFIIEIFFFVS